MSKKNTILQEAKKNKNDEFYTRYEDIAKELPYYKEQLANKIIYCNCDNPKHSNFYKFFKDNFHEYKLKKLVATYFNPDSYTYKTVFDGENEIITELDGYGDFRSPVCVDILQECDVVITNPPFSLFREFVKLMCEYNRKYLIIGNIGAISTQYIFDLLKNGKINIGYSIHSHGMDFIVPNEYDLYAWEHRIDDSGIKYINVKGVRWFTNLEVRNNFIPLKLTKEYNSDEYQKFDDINAINVAETNNIPKDYDGLMGVPISFIDRYNPDEFELFDTFSPYINGKQQFKRIFIKRKI